MLGLTTSTTFNLTASPSRIKSAHSRGLGSDADSDCTVLVRHVTFNLLTGTCPSQPRGIWSQARKKVPGRVCVVSSLPATSRAYFHPQTKTLIPASNHSKPVHTPTRQWLRLLKAFDPESDRESSSGLDPEFDESRSVEAKRITPGESVKAKEVITAISGEFSIQRCASTSVLDRSHKITAEDSSDSGSESSESEEDVLTPKSMTVKVDAPSAPRVLDPRSQIGLSPTLPTTKPSDNCDNSSESSECSSSLDDSGSSSSSDLDSGNASCTGSKPVLGGNKTKVVNMTSTSAASNMDRPTAVTKRRRTDEIGSFVIASVIRQPKASNPHPKENGKGGHRKVITPFSRIKADEVRFADERLKDNTFESRKAATNDYGARVNADLIAMRGAGFRKEKNKKKGSYRGREIMVHLTRLKRCPIADVVFTYTDRKP